MWVWWPLKKEVAERNILCINDTTSKPGCLCHVLIRNKPKNWKILLDKTCPCNIRGLQVDVSKSASQKTNSLSTCEAKFSCHVFWLCVKTDFKPTQLCLRWTSAGIWDLSGRHVRRHHPRVLFFQQQELSEHLQKSLCKSFSSVHSWDCRLHLWSSTDKNILHVIQIGLDQFLILMFCHFPPSQGSVNDVKWSPFSPDVFLSCSSDWTMQLWQRGGTAPVMSFKSAMREVYGVQWFSNCPAVFAAAYEQQVEVWDLNQSMWVSLAWALS